jgi:taurine dioxygenase
MAATRPVVAQPTGFVCRPVMPTIGAEIEGLDLREALRGATLAELRRAWLRWKVLVFRGQHLSHDQHVAFARQFGNIVNPRGPAPPASDDDVPAALEPVSARAFAKNAGPAGDAGDEIDQAALQFIVNGSFSADGRSRWTVQEDRWHADFTCAIEPPAATILRAIEIPPYGGDTLWADTVAAYQALPGTLRNLMDELWAEHRFTNGAVPLDAANPGRMASENAVSVHPVVHVHPETGERALFVNPSFTRHVLWLSPRQSAIILRLLFDHLASPEFGYRLKWTPGDLVIWDNRSTVHLAPADHLEEFGTNRLLYRAMIAGSRPIGVDGTQSRAVSGPSMTEL